MATIARNMPSYEMCILKLRACDRCAAIKQVCDREGESRVCSRCSRLGLPCAITRSHKPMGRPRKNKPLSNPPNSQIEIKQTAAAAAAAAASSVAVAQKPKASTGWPSARTVRTRSGCVTCKQRRKKCDEIFPICSDCNRLGLVCERSSGSSPSNSSPSHHRAIGSLPSSAYCSPARSPPPSHLLLFSSFHNGSTPEEQFLLQHYALVVSRALSVVPDEINPFLTLFVPMAMEQPAMRNALLGLSASHLRRSHQSFEYAMVKYQSRALQQANKLLQTEGGEASTEGLATILFLCLHEICEGKSTKWPLHLEAAATMINSRGGPSAFPSAVQFLLEATAYLDSVATISFSKPTLLDQKFYIPSPPDPQDPTTTTPIKSTPVTAHALFGTAHTLFAAISEISHLAQLRFTRYTTPITDLAFQAKASSLELTLRRFTPTSCSNPSSDETLNSKTTAAALALQWAALMRLHQIVEGYDTTHPKVRVAVANILAAMESIPPGDLVESMLVFPMVMAGVGAASTVEKEIIRKRFRIMGCTIGFGNVFEAAELVERVWESGERWEEAVGKGGGTLIMS